MASREPLVLLPPSEGKAIGGTRLFRPASGAFRRLGGPRQTVIATLAGAVAGGDGSRLLGVRGPLLERARTAVDELGAGRARGLPAWQRYTGVVWEHLEPATLDAADLARVVIPRPTAGAPPAATGTWWCRGADPSPAGRP